MLPAFSQASARIVPEPHIGIVERALAVPAGEVEDGRRERLLHGRLDGLQCDSRGGAASRPSSRGRWSPWSSRTCTPIDRSGSCASTFGRLPYRLRNMSATQSFTFSAAYLLCEIWLRCTLAKMREGLVERHDPRPVDPLRAQVQVFGRGRMELDQRRQHARNEARAVVDAAQHLGIGAEDDAALARLHALGAQALQFLAGRFLETARGLREEAAVLLVQVHAGVPFGGQSSRVISRWSMPHSSNTPPWRLNP